MAINVKYCNMKNVFAQHTLLEETHLFKIIDIKLKLLHRSLCSSVFSRIIESKIITAIHIMCTGIGCANTSEYCSGAIYFYWIPKMKKK